MFRFLLIFSLTILEYMSPMLGRPYRKCYLSLSVVVSDTVSKQPFSPWFFLSQGTAYTWRPASSKNERCAVYRISFDRRHVHRCICTRLWQRFFWSVVIWLLLANPVLFLRATTLPHRGSFGAIWSNSAIESHRMKNKVQTVNERWICNEMTEMHCAARYTLETRNI